MHFTSVICPCGRPTSDTRLCSACILQLRRTIQRLPRLLVDSSKSPNRAAVDEFHWVLNSCVTSWVKQLVADGVPEPGPHVQDVSRMLTWMHVHIDIISCADWAPECLDEFLDACIQLTQLVGAKPKQVYFGPCNGVGLVSGEPCRADLLIAEDERRRPTMECQSCGTTYCVATRNDWILQQHRNRFVTIAEAAALLAIPASTIHTLVRRGRLTRRTNGRLLFADLLDLMAGSRRRAA